MIVSSFINSGDELATASLHFSLISISERGINMVQYVSPARRAADVLVIFWQDLLHVGGIEISGHNERRIWP